MRADQPENSATRNFGPCNPKPAPALRNAAVHRAADTILIAAFALLLCLPATDSVFHLDHASAFNEKRLPASWPSWPESAAGLADYTRGLEAYFNDHFGWRKRLIRWHGDVEMAVFKTQTAKEVILGADGWLFYSGSDTQSEKAAQDRSQFSNQQLADYCRMLEQRRDWLARRGIHYVFVVAPDKQSIYPERLPAWVRPNGARTKLDQFLAYMRTHSSVCIPDLRPELVRAKSVAPTYYETDSHWSLFGGLVATEEIIRAASTQIPTLHPLSLDNFELEPSVFSEGDLISLLGVCATENVLVPKPKRGLPNLIEAVQNPDFVRPTFFTTNAYANGTALVFRDSFGTGLKPFLGYHFKTVGYIWTGADFDPQVVESWRPDIVITEIVERSLDVTHHSELPDPPKLLTKTGASVQLSPR